MRLFPLTSEFKKASLLIIIVISSTFLISKIASASDSWYNSSWQYRTKISINNSGQSSNLSGFPVLVKLTSSNFDFSKAKTDGSDIRFTSSDGTLLDYEIESWSVPDSEAAIWVKIPTITASLSTEFIYAYYGNSGASSAENENSVWNSSFRTVQHLNESAIKPTANDIGTNPFTIQGDANYLYVGNHSSKGLKILSKTDLSTIKTLVQGEIVERLWLKDNYLAFTDNNSKGHIYNLNTDQFVATVSGNDNFRSAHIDSGNRVYFGETGTGKVYYYDISSTAQGTFTPSAAADIRDIGSNGSELLIASNDHNVYLVNKSTLRNTATFSGTLNFEVSQMDDSYLWYGGDDEKVTIRERSSPYNIVAMLHGPAEDITSVDYDGGYWFASSDDGKVYVYSASDYNLVAIIYNGVASFAEQLWLDKTNDVLYYVKGGSSGSPVENKIFTFDYSNLPNYQKKFDSTSNDDHLVGTESASTVTGKIGNATNFDGISTYLEQLRHFNSGDKGVNISSLTNQAFYYAEYANFAPFLGNGSSNNYFLRYHNGSLYESGFVGAAGSGETTVSKVTNGNFESGFSAGLATGWTKDFASFTYTDETTIVHGGSHAQKVTATENSQNLGIRQTMSLDTNKLFRFTAWVYSSGGDTVRFNIGGKLESVSTIANTWTKLSGYVNADSAANIRINVASGNVTTGEYLIIDDVIVEEITDIAANQGAKFYSTKTGSTNALAITDNTIDQNTLTNVGVFSSNLQINGSFTTEAWVNPDSDSGEQHILGNWLGNKGFLLYRSDKKFLAKINSTVIDSGAADKNSGSWYHVALVSDGTSEKIYVNGALYVSEANGVTPPVLSDRFLVGAGGLNPANFFDGKIDEVRISDSARSADWINASYLSGNDSFLSFGALETPSTTTASNTTTPTVTPVCKTSAPNLFAALPNDRNSVSIYFTSIEGAGSYSLRYGTSSNKYVYGASGIGKNSRMFTVNYLSPNTTYYFRIKPDCSGGEWSNEITGKINSSLAFKQSSQKTTPLKSPVKKEEKKIFPPKKVDMIPPKSKTGKPLGEESLFEKLLRFFRR